MKDTDTLVVRYSRFYRVNCSRISPARLDHAGYALDCPKERGVALEFLKNEAVIWSIINKDKVSLDRALERFNIGKDKPIYKTDFFDVLW